MAEETMTTEQGNEPQVPDALTMSDEDFANLDPSTFETAVEDGDEGLTDQDEPEESGSNSSDDSTFDDVSEDEDNEPDSDEEEDADAAAEASDSEEEEEGDEDGEDSTDTDTDTETDAEETQDEDSEDTGDEDSDQEKTDKDDKKDTDEVDYKAEYEKMMAPFKAAGRELNVRNADEARRLMQMGADYNRKMSAIKPVRKTMKLLEKNGLMDESKLGHLIDLSKGNKGAIQKLLKDVGVDPLDLDANEESDYKPGNHQVDDREIELDSVLEDLKDTPTYTKTLDVVSNKWDEQSQTAIADNPGVLEVLNSHMASGVYERIATEVERQRVFGHLKGVSDLEAYRLTGDRMAQEGAFNDLAPKQDQDQNDSQAEKKPVVRKAKTKKPDPKVKERKRAASSTKTKPASRQAGNYDPLAMSDDEFEKQFAESLLR